MEPNAQPANPSMFDEILQYLRADASVEERNRGRYPGGHSGAPEGYLIRTTVPDFGE